tara:strand:+ start:927 stop:1193 length:267 start_codon:yes stop_codon:yes gene_type:complete
MDIKSIVVGEVTKQIEASIPELQNGIEAFVINKVQSKEFEKEWASEINRKVNLPWLNEEQEQELFETLVDKGTDIVAGILSKLLKNKK